MGNKGLPKKLLRSSYRKELWRNVEKIVKKVEKALPISSIYLMGSFVSKKRRPADVDFIIFVKTKEKGQRKWTVDLTIAPDNKYGQLVLKDSDKWVKEKYGLKKSVTIKLK